MTSAHSRPFEQTFAFYRALLTVGEHRVAMKQLVALQQQAVELIGGSSDVGAAARARTPLGITFAVRRAERRLDRIALQSDNAQLQELQRKKAEVIEDIKEERVDFLSNIILGLNDGLIELTGALVGFTFALRDTTVAGASGLITGIAASLSMAASAYLQAKHERHGKHPTKAALYTGGSYLIVVTLLIAPFFLIGNSFASLAVMGVTVALIIAAVSYYSSVVFNKKFTPQFGEMVLFSVGTAIVAFVLGWLVEQFILS